MGHYVYILELNNGKHYVGYTINLKKRYKRHTKGNVNATKAHLPLKLVRCYSFPNRYKAHEFENYLKTGPGRALAVKHLF